MLHRRGKKKSCLLRQADASDVWSGIGPAFHHLEKQGQCVPGTQNSLKLNTYKDQNKADVGKAGKSARQATGNVFCFSRLGGKKSCKDADCTLDSQSQTPAHGTLFRNKHQD